MATARSSRAWKELNHDIVACDRCARLIKHCRKVAKEKRKAYADHEYWGGPVENFGPSNARLLIVGLAPGAHGANRTGRMFTGDRSGDWLYRALHKAGFASQAESTDRKDGLKLTDCAITAVCHCAPPDNKPTREEVVACSEWLDATFDLSSAKVYLALGQIAWKATVDQLIARGEWEGKRPKFGHGAKVEVVGQKWLIGSYHPSQQNTFTGRLTEKMLDDVFRDIKQQLQRVAKK